MRRASRLFRRALAHIARRHGPVIAFVQKHIAAARIAASELEKQL